MEPLLKTEQVMQYFNVKDSRTIAKFRNQGLKYIAIGSRDYRYRREDVEEFAEHQIELTQEKLIQTNPIRRKTRCRTVNIDYEKRKINLQLNKVV